MRIDDWGVSRLDTEGRPHGVAWRDLIKVSILTTSAGPFDEDLFFVLHAADGHACVVPGGCAHTRGLLARLQRLPRFDNEAVIQASTCCCDAELPCWEGWPGEGLSAGEH
ncbi:MAG: hypothetical protein IT373_18770 [Polyangiaceae bacterium]|nr:hypothetical protein [Polyangiaceae bacterium]